MCTAWLPDGFAPKTCTRTQVHAERGPSAPAAGARPARSGGDRASWLAGPRCVCGRRALGTGPAPWPRTGCRAAGRVPSGCPWVLRPAAQGCLPPRSGPGPSAPGPPGPASPSARKQRRRSPTMAHCAPGAHGIPGVTATGHRSPEPDPARPPVKDAAFGVGRGGRGRQGRKGGGGNLTRPHPGVQDAPAGGEAASPAFWKPGREGGAAVPGPADSLSGG